MIRIAQFLRSSLQRQKSVEADRCFGAASRPRHRSEGRRSRACPVTRRTMRWTCIHPPWNDWRARSGVWQTIARC